MTSPIRVVTVIGSGTMGSGIAQASALAGFRTHLFDLDAAALRRGMDRALSQMEEGVRRGKIPADQRDRAVGLLAPASELQTAARASDLVIEAIPEILDLKRRTFTELARVCRPETILASNTSSLSITAIASVASDPGRVIGLHFFNPPHIMKLVEIVRGSETTEEVVRASRGFAAALGKEAIVVRDSPGFATSRLGLALGLEAMRMLETGVASAEDIDRALELGYGHPMGPLRVSDLVGLDVRLSIAEILNRELGGERFAPPEILKTLVREGKLGKKTGQGFHRWDDTGKKPG